MLETGKVDEVFSGETAKSNEKSHSRDMLAALPLRYVKMRAAKIQAVNGEGCED